MLKKKTILYFLFFDYFTIAVSTDNHDCFIFILQELHLILKTAVEDLIFIHYSEIRK